MYLFPQRRCQLGALLVADSSDYLCASGLDRLRSRVPGTSYFLQAGTSEERHRPLKEDTNGRCDIR